MGFNDKLQEFKIEDMFPRKPLINYLWSDYVMHSVDQFGCGKSVACIGTLRRPITDGEKLVYIKENGKFYAANRNFNREKFDCFYTIVGLGYHRIVSEYNGIRVETTLTVPQKGYVECTNISITNVCNKEREFDLYFYCKPYVNTSVHTSYSRADFNDKWSGLLYTHNGYKLEHPYNTVFIKSDKQIKGYSVTDAAFIGRYNKSDNPQSLHNEELNSEGATFDDYFCGALQFSLRLAAGETQNINIAVAVGKDEEAAVSAANLVCSQKAYEECLLYQKDLHAIYNAKFTVQSPDEDLNRAVNIWLKRQISFGKTWGRGYGKGFRDVMQDCQGFVSLDIGVARERILHALGYQFDNGNTIRQYEPDFDEPYMDGAAWIPATISAYLKESGDFSILNEVVPYYRSNKSDTVLAHMQNGLNFLITHTGDHGLVLWGGGDWNDSLNGCGVRGTGESVWLSMATVKAINEYEEIAERLSLDMTELSTARARLTECIMKFGLEGDRFIYGFNDNGDKIGSKDSAQAKIYLNPQTWSLLSGIADKTLANKLFATVNNELRCKFGYKQCNPSYSHGDNSIGRASFFVQGLVENGAVYNHGCAFKIMADCKLGDGKLAYNDYLLMKANNPENPDNGMEPYAVSNMYIGEECPYKSMRGFAPMSWVTGTASWLYRDLTEGILGVTAQFDGLKISPCLPDGWSGIHIIRVYRDAKYDIIIRRGERKTIYDEMLLSDDVVPYDGNNHCVEVWC